ncbi:MAG TPA: SDR family oxidoreductase [Gemmatimonadales bacterium]|nr:SDR family oxidoreductase [Gemmatimonadales bacterium]
MELRGRNALVTGAGQRVGRAIAYGLIRRGVNVAIHYHRSERGAKATMMEGEVAGVRVAMLKADLGDAGAAEELPARAAQALGGPLDIAVLSAAVMERRPLEDVTPADWDRVIDLNLRGTFFAAKGAAAAMGARGGAIVALADLSSFRPWRHYPVHTVSKAGVVALTQQLAKALAPRVRVNAVAPGAVLLPEGWGEDEKAKLVASTPLGRLGTPDDVVRAVLFLVESDYVTGTTVVVDGGRLLR